MLPRALPDAERGYHPGANVVGDRDRAQEVAAGAAHKLAGGQRRRYRAAAHVNRPDRIGVVGLVGMGRHGIGQRRIDGGGHDAGADHHRLRLAADAVHIAGGEISRLEARAGHHRAQSVEHMQLAPRHHLGRQLAIERRRHIIRERAGGRGDGRLGGRVGNRGRRRRCGGLRVGGGSRNGARQNRRAAGIDQPTSGVIRLVAHGGLPGCVELTIIRGACGGVREIRSACARWRLSSPRKSVP